MSKTFIHFEGTIWENLDSIPAPGWESNRPAHEPESGDGSFALELLDQDGNVAVSVSPLADFDSGCDVRGGRMRFARIVSHIPLVEKAATLRLRSEQKVIYQQEIAATPPSIKITGCRLDRRGLAHLQWRARHDRPLSYNVAFVSGKRRPFLLARGLTGSKTTVSTGNLPGGPGRFSVLATDGVRSDSATSRQVRLTALPRLRILQPLDGGTFPPDQPATLLGQVLDGAGSPLSPESFVWEVDGRTIARGTRQSAVFGLVPGAHRVTLSYPDRGGVVNTTVRFKVAKRSPQQQQWRDWQDARGA